MLIIGAFTLGSCDKELEVLNPQAVDASLAFSTDDKVKLVLVGTYVSMGNSSLFGGDLLWMSELMGSDGDLTWAGTFPDLRQIWAKSILQINTNVRSTYNAAYGVIAQLNQILASLNVVDSADRTRVEAEAKFIRGMLYFELVKFFGEKSYSFGSPGSLKGVPLVLEPRPEDARSAENYVPRSTVEAVYAQILDDLTDAEAGLPNRNGVYANKPAASLALARVYLQMLNYAAARDAANRCITVAVGNQFRLVPDYADAFNNEENTTEDLFAMQVNTQTGTNSNFTYFSTTTYGSRAGDIEVNEEHLDKYTPGDLRLDLFFEDNDGIMYVGKWRDQYRNVKVMRLAEAYLVRAECNSRLGTTVGATVAADLDMTRKRAGLAFLAAPTLTQVLAERELELAFEGQALPDLKRLKLSADGFAYDDNKMVFPIPQRETTLYPIEQNPGY